MPYSHLHVLICGILLLTTTSELSRAAPQSSVAATDQAPQLSQRYPQYQLHINDLLDVNFDLSPELNQGVRVTPDGYISLRGIQPVHVEGQTIPQAVETIKKAYGDILNNPVVAVILKEYEKPFFIATGEVQKPGKYDLLSQTTATQGVAIAGGFNADAKHSQVAVFRQVPNGWTQVAVLNLKSMLNQRDLSEDLRLQPGDLIYIPKNTLSKIARFIPKVETGVHYSIVP
jgi:polysaccharide biosynthesis/export protein